MLDKIKIRNMDGHLHKRIILAVCYLLAVQVSAQTTEKTFNKPCDFPIRPPQIGLAQRLRLFARDPKPAVVLRIRSRHPIIQAVWWVSHKNDRIDDYIYQVSERGNGVRFEGERTGEGYKIWLFTSKRLTFVGLEVVYDIGCSHRTGFITVKRTNRHKAFEPYKIPEVLTTPMPTTERPRLKFGFRETNVIITTEEPTTTLPPTTTERLTTTTGRRQTLVEEKDGRGEKVIEKEDYRPTGEREQTIEKETREREREETFEKEDHQRTGEKEDTIEEERERYIERERYRPSGEREETDERETYRPTGRGQTEKETRPREVEETTERETYRPDGERETSTPQKEQTIERESYKPEGEREYTVPEREETIERETYRPEGEREEATPEREETMERETYRPSGEKDETIPEREEPMGRETYRPSGEKEVSKPEREDTSERETYRPEGERIESIPDREKTIERETYRPSGEREETIPEREETIERETYRPEGEREESTPDREETIQKETYDRPGEKEETIERETYRPSGEREDTKSEAQTRVEPTTRPPATQTDLGDNSVDEVITEIFTDYNVKNYFAGSEIQTSTKKDGDKRATTTDRPEWTTQEMVKEKKERKEKSVEVTIATTTTEYYEHTEDMSSESEVRTTDLDSSDYYRPSESSTSLEIPHESSTVSKVQIQVDSSTLVPIQYESSTEVDKSFDTSTDVGKAEVTPSDVKSSDVSFSDYASTRPFTIEPSMTEISSPTSAPYEVSSSEVPPVVTSESSSQVLETSEFEESTSIVMESSTIATPDITTATHGETPVSTTSDVAEPIEAETSQEASEIPSSEMPEHSIEPTWVTETRMASESEVIPQETTVVSETTTFMPDIEKTDESRTKKDMKETPVASENSTPMPDVKETEESDTEKEMEEEFIRVTEKMESEKNVEVGTKPMDTETTTSMMMVEKEVVTSLLDDVTTDGEESMESGKETTAKPMVESVTEMSDKLEEETVKVDEKSEEPKFVETTQMPKAMTTERAVTAGPQVKVIEGKMDESKKPGDFDFKTDESEEDEMDFSGAGEVQERRNSTRDVVVRCVYHCNKNDTNSTDAHDTETMDMGEDATAEGTGTRLDETIDIDGGEDVNEVKREEKAEKEVVEKEEPRDGPPTEAPSGWFSWIGS